MEFWTDRRPAIAVLISWNWNTLDEEIRRGSSFVVFSMVKTNPRDSRNSLPWIIVDLKSYPINHFLFFARRVACILNLYIIFRNPIRVLPLVANWSLLSTTSHQSAYMYYYVYICPAWSISCQITVDQPILDQLINRVLINFHEESASNSLACWLLCIHYYH